MVVFDRDTNYWIEDRLANREALMWNEFIRFKCGEPDEYEENGTKELAKKYKDKEYRKAVKKKYETAKRRRQWGDRY